MLRVRISIVVIFCLAVIINSPNWFTVVVYRREDGRLRANDTALYNSMPAYYFAYHVSPSKCVYDYYRVQDNGSCPLLKKGETSQSKNEKCDEKLKLSIMV